MVKFFCSKKGKIFAEIWSFGRKNALSREQSGDVVIIGLSQDRLEYFSCPLFGAGANDFPET